MVDIVVVVDPQNSYCKKGGISFDKEDEQDQRGVETALKMLSKFLGHPSVTKLPCVYLLSNMWRRGTEIPQWQTAIVDNINHRHGAIFHRMNPDSDPFDHGCETFLTVCRKPRLVLCGFYGDQCVAHAGLCALQRRIPLVFVTDCTYPTFGSTLQKTFKETAQKKYGVLPSILFLTATEYVARLKNV